MDYRIKLKEKLKNKWWRLNNLYWIVDQYGKEVKFRCNWAQEKFYDDLWYLNILLKARQWGGTTFVDLYFLDECLFSDNVEAGIIAHNKEDAQKIFRRKVQFPYKKLPDWLKKQRSLVTDSKSELAFSNGSIIYVATSVRSGTVQYLHISEHGKICRKYPDKAEEIKTGSLNAIHPGETQMVVIESTAEGQYGDFFDMCSKAMQTQDSGKELTKMDYKFHFVPWFWNNSYQIDTTGIIIPPGLVQYFEELEVKEKIKLTDRQKAWYAKKKERLTDKIFQEYPSTPAEAFRRIIEGAYYSVQMTALRKNGQITKVPHEPTLPVNTAWDLGMDDETVLIFHQRHGLENRIIDYYQNNDNGIAHYVGIMSEKGYNYGEHFLPHDVTVRELGTGKTRLEVLQKLLPGQRITVVPKIDLVDGIEATRNFIPLCWIDETKCDQLIKGLDAYQREWDDRVGGFKSKPFHNWASHPADAMRSLAVGFTYKPKDRSKYRKKNRRGRVV